MMSNRTAYKISEKIGKLPKGKFFQLDRIIVRPIHQSLAMFAHKTTSEEQKSFLKSFQVREITKFILQNSALLHSVSRKVGSLLLLLHRRLFRGGDDDDKRIAAAVQHLLPKSQPQWVSSPQTHLTQPQGGEEVSLLLPPLSCGQFLEGVWFPEWNAVFSWHLFFEFLMREFRLSNFGSPKKKEEREGIMWEIPTRVSQRSSFEGRFTISLFFHSECGKKQLRRH